MSAAPTFHSETSGGSELSARRDLLLQTALDLFEQSGVRATGIDLILRQSGVAKMTLYKHFKSKDELVRQVLEIYADRWFDRFSDAYRTNAPAPATGRVLRVFDVLESAVADRSTRGILLCRTAHELQYPEDVLALIRAHDHRMLGFLEAEVAQIPREPAARVARQIYLLMVGALELSSAHRWTDAFAEARATAGRLLA